MARTILAVSEAPSALKAFKGMILAVGAIKCTRPAVMVPCPNAGGVPSRILSVDCVRIASVELLNWDTRLLSSMLSVDWLSEADALGLMSAISEPPARLRVKSYPRTKTPAKAG